MSRLDEYLAYGLGGSAIVIVVGAVALQVAAAAHGRLGPALLATAAVVAGLLTYRYAYRLYRRARGRMPRDPATSRS